MRQNWLITVGKDVKLENLEDELKELNSEITNLETIPLDSEEQVVFVAGPSDLPQKLQTNPDIISIYSNSEFTLDS